MTFVGLACRELKCTDFTLGFSVVVFGLYSRPPDLVTADAEYFAAYCHRPLRIHSLSVKGV